jgi:hypothetical protein
MPELTEWDSFHRVAIVAFVAIHNAWDAVADYVFVRIQNAKD